MAEVKPQNKGTKQLFKSPVLEKLSRTHISVPLAVFFSYSAILLYWSVANTALPAWLTIALFFTGMVFFTWVEYLMHRYVFHMEVYNQSREKLQYVIHGVHHEYPKDKTRLAMPPLLSITISTILLLILRVVMGDYVFAFLPGFLCGYALYLSAHYVIHAYQPPRNFLKYLWVNHGIHHYKNGEMVFGVSSPLWDYIYGTMNRPIKRKHSESVRTYDELHPEQHDHHHQVS
jgi:sterol desaturase/sphingolipid hydroxylase (fatty acid hydroxylase superfamily)